MSSFSSRAAPGAAPPKEPKFLIVTGGTVSGLGKGTAISSLGVVLKSHGLKVTSMKIDPYLNVDAGTMSPFEHGEVFVLDDGGEADLDLGNYERFLDVNLESVHSLTSGKIYQKVLQRERAGDFLGKTVQMVPHVTDAIQVYSRTILDFLSDREFRWCPNSDKNLGFFWVFGRWGMMGISSYCSYVLCGGCSCMAAEDGRDPLLMAALDMTFETLSYETAPGFYSHNMRKCFWYNFFPSLLSAHPFSFIFPILLFSQDWIMDVASKPTDSTGERPDICLIELGGTVGDIESAVYLEALQQLQFKMGSEHFITVHLGWVPYQNATGEQKTKPCQHSVKTMREAGLKPDLLICRSQEKISSAIRQKLSLFCQVKPEEVISLHDVSNIFRVPILLAEQKAGDIVGSIPNCAHNFFGIPWEGFRGGAVRNGAALVGGVSDSWFEARRTSNRDVVRRILSLYVFQFRGRGGLGRVVFLVGRVGFSLGRLRQQAALGPPAGRKSSCRGDSRRRSTC